jgi:thiamine biosynthesis lipoprotein
MGRLIGTSFTQTDLRLIRFMTPSPSGTEPISTTEFSLPNMRRFAHVAMATTFELVMIHPQASYAHQAAWAAFEELDRMEQELSRFIENSDISRINSLPSGQTIQVGEAAFECVQVGKRMFEETGGAFDISVGSGMKSLKLNKSRQTVRTLKEGVQLDLGGIGKGYAVDKIAELLQEWDIKIALIHGGQSSVRALDAPPGRNGWPITLSIPGASYKTLARASIKHQSLSGSGLQKGSHIIDPQTRNPVGNKRAVWICLPGLEGTASSGQESAADKAEQLYLPAALAETLSTAFIVMPLERIRAYCERHPEVGALLAQPDEAGEGDKLQLLHFGSWLK